MSSSVKRRKITEDASSKVIPKKTKKAPAPEPAAEKFSSPAPEASKKADEAAEETQDAAPKTFKELVWFENIRLSHTVY
jgi:hypothetical protein